MFTFDDQKTSKCSYYHPTFKITSSNKNANEITSRTTILTYISLLESSLQNGFHFNFTQQPDLLFRSLLCIPRKRIHNSPLPRLEILGDSIRGYGPRATTEITFSATGQASTYLKSTSVRDQWKIDRYCIWRERACASSHDGDGNGSKNVKKVITVNTC